MSLHNMVKDLLELTLKTTINVIETTLVVKLVQCKCHGTSVVFF